MYAAASRRHVKNMDNVKREKIQKLYVVSRRMTFICIH